MKSPKSASARYLVYCRAFLSLPSLNCLTFKEVARLHLLLKFPYAWAEFTGAPAPQLHLSHAQAPLLTSHCPLCLLRPGAQQTAVPQALAKLL